MKRTAIGAGAYADQSGGYWARPVVNHRRTWRKLAARTARKAIAEANTAEFTAKSETFADLAQLWMDSNCPGKRDKSHNELQVEAARIRARSLVGFFGKFRAAEIRLHHLPQYADWRKRQRNPTEKIFATALELPFARSQRGRVARLSRPDKPSSAPATGSQQTPARAPRCP